MAIVVAVEHFGFSEFDDSAWGGEPLVPPEWEEARLIPMQSGLRENAVPEKLTINDEV